MFNCIKQEGIEKIVREEKVCEGVKVGGKKAKDKKMVKRSSERGKAGSKKAKERRRVKRRYERGKVGGNKAREKYKGKQKSKKIYIKRKRVGWRQERERETLKKQ